MAADHPHPGVSESDRLFAGKPMDMDGRVSSLETHMDYVRADLGDIKSTLKDIVVHLNALPTRRDLNNYVIGGIGLALAAVAVVVGGLGWLETRASRVQSAPTVIMLPSAQAAAPVKAARP